MYNVHLTHSLLCFEFVEFTLISFIGYYFIRLKAYSSEQRKISMYKYKIFFKKINTLSIIFSEINITLNDAYKIIIFRYFKTSPYTVTLQCQIN